MTLVVLNILVGLVIGFGAVQDLIVRGVWGRDVQPLFINIGSIVVSVLFIVSAVAMWRKWPNARRLVIVTAVLSILIHVYAALPPHRSMGIPALLIGAGYGLVLLIITLSSRGANTEAALS